MEPPDNNVSTSPSPSHCKELAENLYILQKDGLFCDVALVAAGERFLAHSVVLAAASAPLRSRLASEEGLQPRSPVELRLSGVSRPESLRAVLECLYGQTPTLDLRPRGVLQEVHRLLDALRVPKSILECVTRGAKPCGAARLIRNLSIMRSKHRLCDIALVTARGEKTLAHRAVLAAACPVFRVYLGGHASDIGSSVGASLQLLEACELQLDAISSLLAMEAMVDHIYVEGRANESCEPSFSEDLVLLSEALELPDLLTAQQTSEDVVACIKAQKPAKSLQSDNASAGAPVRQPMRQHARGWSKNGSKKQKVQHLPDPQISECNASKSESFRGQHHRVRTAEKSRSLKRKTSYEARPANFNPSAEPSGENAHHQMHALEQPRCLHEKVGKKQSPSREDYTSTSTEKKRTRRGSNTVPSDFASSAALCKNKTSSVSASSAEERPTGPTAACTTIEDMSRAGAMQASEGCIFASEPGKHLGVSETGAAKELVSLGATAQPPDLVAAEDAARKVPKDTACMRAPDPTMQSGSGSAEATMQQPKAFARRRARSQTGMVAGKEQSSSTSCLKADVAKKKFTKRAGKTTTTTTTTSKLAGVVDHAPARLAVSDDLNEHALSAGSHALSDLLYTSGSQKLLELRKASLSQDPVQLAEAPVNQTQTCREDLKRDVSDEGKFELCEALQSPGLAAADQSSEVAAAGASAKQPELTGRQQRFKGGIRKGPKRQSLYPAQARMSEPETASSTVLDFSSDRPARERLVEKPCSSRRNITLGARNTVTLDSNRPSREDVLDFSDAGGNQSLLQRHPETAAAKQTAAAKEIAIPSNSSDSDAIGKSRLSVSGSVSQKTVARAPVVATPQGPRRMQPETSGRMVASPMRRSESGLVQGFRQRAQPRDTVTEMTMLLRAVVGGTSGVPLQRMRWGP